MVGRAAEPFHPSFDIGVETLRVDQIAATRKDDLGGFSGDLAAGFRCACLNDDRPSLDLTVYVRRAAHREKLALVIQHMQPLGIEIDAVLDIADEGVVGPAVPQSGDDLEE